MYKLAEWTPKRFFKFKKKEPPKKAVTDDIDDTADRIYDLYCKALGGFGDNIIDYVAKMERVQRRDIYDALDSDEAIVLYKKYKKFYDDQYKKALYNLIKALPEIKKEWVTYLKQLKELPPQDVRWRADRAKNYIKHMRVDNRKLAVGMIGFDALTNGTMWSYLAPDHYYEDTQTYSYCVVDYG